MGVLLARLEYHRSEVRMIHGIGPFRRIQMTQIKNIDGSENNWQR